MRGAALAGLVALAAVPASAADCLLDRAIYAQDTSAYELHFHPVEMQDYRAASTTNQFTVRVPGFDRLLRGDVIWNNGLSRPNGTIFLDCPEGASSHDDFAGCTIWEGVIYALTGSTITLLPEEGVPPPEQILLPDLQRAFHYGVWDVDFSADETPWEVFTLKGCAP